MQKSFVLSLAAIATMSTANAQSFTLTGKYTGGPIDYIYLSYPNAKGEYIKDSSKVADGRFAFKGELKGISYGSVQGMVATRSMDDPNVAYVFLEPGKMTVEVAKDKFKEIKVTGSATQKEMDGLNKQKDGLKKQWAPFFHALDSVNKIDNFKFQEMKEGLKPYYKEMEKYDFAYIDKHPGTYLSAYLLRGYSMSLPTDKLQAYYNTLSEDLKTSMGKTMHDELERRKIGVPGTTAYAFSKTDINGETFQLADYKGKYVLIDFWASWCLPCRKGNPHLKKLYAEYKDKGFEIVGVSDDDSKQDAWRKAVADDGIGVWKHVLRGLDWEKLRANIPNPNDLSKQYGIATLPTKILVDKEGKIIGRYSGGEEDDAKMDAQLKTIFNQ